MEVKVISNDFFFLIFKNHKIFTLAEEYDETDEENYEEEYEEDVEMYENEEQSANAGYEDSISPPKKAKRLQLTYLQRIKRRSVKW